MPLSQQQPDLIYNKKLKTYPTLLTNGYFMLRQNQHLKEEEIPGGRVKLKQFSGLALGQIKFHIHSLKICSGKEYLQAIV